MRVAVLCGGISGEAEISRLSGNTVNDALLSLGHETRVFEFEPDHLEVLREWRPDVVFPTLHGPLGEDGTAAAVLELLRLPYVGSGILAGALAMNKVAAKRVWTALDLPTPAAEVVDEFAEMHLRAEDAIERLGLPMVVKPNSGGSSLGFSRVADEESLLDGIVRAMKVAGPDHAVLLEAEKRGVEVTVGVLGVRAPVALPTLEIVYREGDYDFEAKYTAGLSQHVIPARIPEPQQARAAALALAAHRALGARGLSRVDMMCEPGGECWLLELNTMPGMTPLSLFPDAARAAGLEFPQLVERLIQEAVAA